MIIMKYNLLLDSSLTKLLRQSGVPRFHGSLTPSDWVRQKERKKNSVKQNNHLELLLVHMAEVYRNSKLKWRKRSENWKTNFLRWYVRLRRQTQTGFVDPNAVNKKRIFDLYFNSTIYRVVILRA